MGQVPSGRNKNGHFKRVFTKSRKIVELLRAGDFGEKKRIKKAKKNAPNGKRIGGYFTRGGWSVERRGTILGEGEHNGISPGTRSKESE